jgi:hypothetical protein
LLSPRVLYFSPTQLTFFSPQSAKVDGGVPFHTFNHRKFAFLPRDKGQNHIGETSDPVVGGWEWIIEEYTNLKLSEPGDKMLAISATAEALGVMFFGSQLARDSYQAGLWKQGQPLTLLWHRRDKSVYPRPSYRAPTWSWASIDGRVLAMGPKDFRPRMRGIPTVILAHVLECDVQLAVRSAPYGQILGGQLRIEGLLKEVPSYSIDGHSITVSDPDYVSGQFVVKTYLDAMEPDDILSAAGRTVSLFCIEELSGAETEWDKYDYRRGGVWLGWLILRRRDGENGYSRIGVMSIGGQEPRELQEIERWQAMSERKIITIV